MRFGRDVHRGIEATLSPADAWMVVVAEILRRAV
jgi:hypothetical protein